MKRKTRYYVWWNYKIIKDKELIAFPFLKVVNGKEYLYSYDTGNWHRNTEKGLKNLSDDLPYKLKEYKNDWKETTEEKIFLELL